MTSRNVTYMKGDESLDGKETNKEEYNKVILSLPREDGFTTKYVYFYNEFWYPSNRIKSIISFQNHFEAKDSDIIVASMPKSGTTWLSALTFAIVNRLCFPPFQNNHPLLKSHPQELFIKFDSNLFGENDSEFPQIDLQNINEPRLFFTHIPFQSLAKSIKESNCKIVYICRNPFDTFVSYWKFVNKIRSTESLVSLTLEECFERYCNGICSYGPFWDNVLGYFKASQARPDNVLFLKYEELHKDGIFQAKRIAKFVGFPFTIEEENNGVIENIIKLCSFDNLKELEVNKSGIIGRNIEKSFFFRKGEIGDFVNYLSPSMIEKLSKIVEEKLSGSNLSFKVYY